LPSQNALQMNLVKARDNQVRQFYEIAGPLGEKSSVASYKGEMPKK